MAQRILRPLDYGGIFDELFDLYKKNFLVFAGISAFVYIPCYTIMFGIFISVMASMQGAMTPASNPSGAEFTSVIVKFIGAMLLLLFLSMLAYFPAQAATTWAVSKCYLGESITIVDSFKAVSRRIVMFAVTVTVTAMIIGLGSMLCFVPGIIFALWFAFVSPVYILEGKSLGDALTRSKQLAEGNWGRIAVVYIISAILTQVISRVLLMPFQIPMESQAMSGLAPSFGYFYGMMAGVAMTISAPITIIAFTLLYYDIRIRKEGFDIEMLASNMGQTTGASPDSTENPFQR